MRGRADATRVPRRAAVAVDRQPWRPGLVDEDVRCRDAFDRGDVDRRRRRRDLAGRGADVVELVCFDHALVAVGPHLDRRVAEQQGAAQRNGDLHRRIDHQRVARLPLAEHDVDARVVHAVPVGVVERAYLEPRGRGGGALVGDGGIERPAQGEGARIARDLLRVDRAHDQVGQQGGCVVLAEAHRADVDVGKRRKLESEILGQVARQREADLRLPRRQPVDLETPVGARCQLARGVADDRLHRHAGERLVAGRVEDYAPHPRNVWKELQITESYGRRERAVLDRVEQHRIEGEAGNPSRSQEVGDKQLTPWTEVQTERAVEPVADDLAVREGVARRVEQEPRDAVTVDVRDEQLTTRAECHIVRVVEPSARDDSVRDGVAASVEDISVDRLDSAALGDEQLARGRMRDDAAGSGVAEASGDDAVRYDVAGALKLES